MVWHVKGLLWFGMIHLSAEGGTDRFGFGISGFGFRVSDFGVGVSGSKYTLVRVQPSPFGLIPRRQPEGDSRLRALIRFSSKGGGGVQSAARPESLRGWATRNLGIAVCPQSRGPVHKQLPNAVLRIGQQFKQIKALKEKNGNGRNV